MIKSSAEQVRKMTPGNISQSEERSRTSSSNGNAARATSTEAPVVVRRNNTRRSSANARAFVARLKAPEQRVQNLRFLTVGRKHREIDVRGGPRFSPSVHDQATDQTGRDVRDAQRLQDLLCSGSQHRHTGRVHLFVRALPKTS